MKTFAGQEKLLARSEIELLLKYCEENLFVKTSCLRCTVQVTKK